MEKTLDWALREMTRRICGVLEDNAPTVYLYGSVPAGDFRPGWSDIDLLVLTPAPLSESAAARLVGLRQALVEEYRQPLFRAFEGGMLSLPAFLSDRRDRVVYWGTSGQRLRPDYDFNSLTMLQLITGGVLLTGPEVRSRMPVPARGDLVRDIRAHLESVRLHGRDTDRSLYSFGWMLDIARCLYTLETGAIAPKTAAGEWALARNLCPDPEALAMALAARRDPPAALADPETMDRAGALGPAVQRFADALEAALAREPDEPSREN